MQDSVGVVVSFPAATSGSEIKFSGCKAGGTCGISVGADATDAKGNPVAHLSSNNNPAGQFSNQATLDMKAAHAHLTLSISAPAGDGGPNPCDAMAQIDVIGKAP